MESKQKLILYSARDCHLCKEAKEVLQRLQEKIEFDLEIVDISGNEQLEQRYRAEIPVLELQGRKLAKFHVDPETVQRALSGQRLTAND